MSLFQSRSDNSESEIERANITLLSVHCFEDAEKAVDGLENCACLIINTAEAEQTQKQRVLDYLSGATHALSLIIKQLAQNAWIIAPEQMISSELDTSETLYSSTSGFENGTEYCGGDQT